MHIYNFCVVSKIPTTVKRNENTITVFIEIKQIYYRW